MAETLSRRIFHASFFVSPLLGELLCKRESNNTRDSCAVAFIKDGRVVEVLQQYIRIVIIFEASHVKTRRD